ncbi:hypothetical protein [Arsenicibacter rosenii]|uniref:Uncharacterized protein n=1 Tax=Arsenicibacter rosenii TaxID=1750698 RepID=A0A1S2VE78_9BACT|nr:hypothetical protein [Arsenicibacter rosenii]OIN56585.1 hypothetical protein BLX24_24270 [Arsenicibacter rosenii]
MSAIKKIGIIAFLLAMTAMRGTIPAYGIGAISYQAGGRHITAERGKQAGEHINWISRTEDEQEYQELQAGAPFDLLPVAMMFSLLAVAWLLFLGRSFRRPFNIHNVYQPRPYYLLFHSLRIPGNHRM